MYLYMRVYSCLSILLSHVNNYNKPWYIYIIGISENLKGTLLYTTELSKQNEDKTKTRQNYRACKTIMALTVITMGAKRFDSLSASIGIGG